MRERERKREKGKKGRTPGHEMKPRIITKTKK